MKVEHHVLISGAVSGALYCACEDWRIAAAAFAGGVAIDADHLIDYLVEFGLRSDWRNFFSSFYEGRYTRIYIILHAWELILALGAAAWLTGWNAWMVGVLAGTTQHMVLDQVFNGAAGMGYWLTWRWRRGFDPAPVFPRKKMAGNPSGLRD